MIIISSQFDYIFEGFSFLIRKTLHIAFNILLIILMVYYKDTPTMAEGSIRPKIGIYVGIIWFIIVTIFSCFNLMNELLI